MGGALMSQLYHFPMGVTLNKRKYYLKDCCQFLYWLGRELPRSLMNSNNHKEWFCKFFWGWVNFCNTATCLHQIFAKVNDLASFFKYHSSCNTYDGLKVMPIFHRPLWCPYHFPDRYQMENIKSPLTLRTTNGTLSQKIWDLIDNSALAEQIANS